MTWVARWTDEQDEALRKHHAAGLTYTQIGLAMGLNKNKVIGRAHRLKLPARPAAVIPKSDSVSARHGAKRSLARAPNTSPGARQAETSAAPVSPSRAAPGAGVALSLPPSPANLPGQAARLTNPSPVRVFSDRKCQFPRWGHRKPDNFLFCGEPVTARACGSASPYCTKHHAICYTMTNKEAGNPPPLRWRA